MYRFCRFYVKILQILHKYLNWRRVSFVGYWFPCKRYLVDLLMPLTLTSHNDQGVSVTLNYLFQDSPHLKWKNSLHSTEQNLSFESTWLITRGRPLRSFRLNCGQNIVTLRDREWKQTRPKRPKPKPKPENLQGTAVAHLIDSTWRHLPIKAGQVIPKWFRFIYFWSVVLSTQQRLGGDPEITRQFVLSVHTFSEKIFIISSLSYRPKVNLFFVVCIMRVVRI